MQIFRSAPRLIFDAIATLDTRVDILEAKILPVAPTTTVLIDGTNGNDNNDGFNNPVQTDVRLQEVLDGYDWQKQLVYVSIQNTASFSVNGKANPNWEYIDFDFNNQILSSGTVTFEYFDNINVFNLTFAGASNGGAFLFCETASLQCDVASPTKSSGSLISIQGSNSFNLSFPTTPVVNIAGLDLVSCTDTKTLLWESNSPGTITRVRNLFDLIRVENFQWASSFNTTITTGRLFDAETSPFINIQKLGTHTASLSDVYPTAYILNTRIVVVPSYTCRLSGLLPSVATNTTQWQIGIGEGQIVDGLSDISNPTVRKVSRTTVLTANKPTQLNGTVTSVYAYYFWNGTAIALGYQTTAPVADDLIDKLFLCSIISLNGTNIAEVRPINLPDEPLTKSLLNKGLGINIDNVFPTPLANTARLSIAAQKVMFAGRWHHVTPKTPHTTTLAAVNPIQYYLVNPTTGEPFAPLTLQTDFNFNRVWNGTALVNLSNANNFSVQFIYRYPNGVFLVVPGINEYTSLQFAATLWHGVETLRFPSSLKSNCLYIGAIAGRGNLTNIANNNPTSGQALLINNYVQS